MEYRFGTLEDYLTETKGSTGIWPVDLGTLNIDPPPQGFGATRRPTPNIEVGIFANVRVGEGVRNGASQVSKWVRFFRVCGNDGDKVLNSWANQKMTNGFVW